MNPIHKLFDEKFVISLFKKRILPRYPDFVDIKRVEIKPHKSLIWEEEAYHVVLEFKTHFLTRNGKIKKLPIFCSAHFEEPRKNLYRALKYLWDNGFSKGYLTVPHPLFYSSKFKAAFYRGAQGRNFYQYIRKSDRKEIENLIPKIAAWFAKLHSLPTNGVPNFNKENSLIKTTIPGREEIMTLLGYRYPYYQETFKNFYDNFIKKEESFLKSTKKRWLVHGDAHPENVIKMGKHKLALIDFNDICLSDFARDLGCFLQQFEYMAMRKIGDAAFVEKMKRLFLDSYFDTTKVKLDDSLKERIDNYYNWTAVRTAIFMLLKDKPDTGRARSIIKKLKEKI